jgi:hypothetical protein
MNLKPEEQAGKPATPANDCEYKVVHDFRTHPARLRVEGTCVMPTPGYRLSLRRADPQGINPNILILELQVEAPTGIVTQVLTPTPVAYEEETDQHFTSVTIEPDGVSVEVKELQ